MHWDKTLWMSPDRLCPLRPSNQQLTTVITLFASQLLFCQRHKHQSPVQCGRHSHCTSHLPNVAMIVQTAVRPVFMIGGKETQRADHLVLKQEVL